MPDSLTTTTFLLLNRTGLCCLCSITDPTVLWPSRRASCARRKTIGYIRFVTRECSGMGPRTRERAGVGAVNFKGRCKVDIVRMNYSAGIALGVIIDGEKQLDVDIDLFALAQQNRKSMTTRISLELKSEFI
jgi:hypothetical protein